MLSGGNISRASQDSNMAYLHAVWNSRLSLKDQEKLGFAQFFYIFLNTHIESQLVALINFRLDSIRNFVQTASRDRVYHLTHTLKSGAPYPKAKEIDTHPSFHSIHKMVTEKYEGLKSASIGRLIKTYDSLFLQSLKAAIGEDLKRDLDAVSSMRNIFAHGRRIGIDLENSSGILKANIESSTLKEAVQRLQKANLLSKVEPTSAHNYHLWESSIFSDSALLYFYNRIMLIDSKLKDCECSLQERARIALMPCLPELGST
jgi:hypothetical protein